jgi:hypothetical protein
MRLLGADYPLRMLQEKRRLNARPIDDDATAKSRVVFPPW